MPNKADQANGGNRSATGMHSIILAVPHGRCGPLANPSMHKPQPQEMDWGKKQRRRVTDDAQRKAATERFLFTLANSRQFTPKNSF
ncbi:MAG: hypothetical protein CM1200mP41_10900 [Gammaproteobacteria bacterium]|nr:MAG: hypothetical protein CM1200mP41_10900 [Gammaproteobacteria bacterium]